MLVGRRFEMKRIAFLFGGVSLFAWGLSGALAGCGTDDTPVNDTAGDGGTSTSSGGSSGATSSSGGSSSGASSSGGSSSGSTGDGGGNDGGADGGSTPNKIACGAAECTSPAQVCCRSFQDAGCINAADNCTGLKVECDEKADCTGGNVCCYGAFGAHSCDTDCNGFGNFQICKTSTECADAGTCKEWSCPGNFKVQACEKPFNGCQ
jgi:hypothetical protein